MNVVIVEDSGVMARMLQMLIERHGWCVAGRAESAEAALALIASVRPDVVTLDLTLAGGGSLTLLKAVTEGLGIPVVVVSAAVYEGSPAVAEALKSGADACVDKASMGKSDALLDALIAAVGTEPAACLPVARSTDRHSGHCGR
jgi:two-component system, chemotaxis family, protein-glutamate methylesterase/glutaminase